MSNSSSGSKPVGIGSFHFDGSVIDTMLASALSGMVARIPLHPIDTCKAKLQVQQQFKPSVTPPGGSPLATIPLPKPKSFVEFFSHTLRSEGIRGLYSGFGITFFGSGPAACLYFTSYEASKTILGSMPAFRDSPVFFTHFVSGLLAECASCVLWVPIDVVKERLQVQQQLKELMEAKKSVPMTPNASITPAISASASSSAAAATASSSASHFHPHAAPPSNAPPATLYRGNLHAIATIARNEGLRGVYRGYGATVASFGPFSAIYLSGYEQFKSLFSRLLPPPSQPNSKDEMTFLGYAASGAAAGCLASVVTNPLDLVKLRMQVQRGNSGFTFGYRHIGHGLVRIVREEGMKALFKGAGARCMFHIPSTAITIAMFDTLRNYLTKIRTGGKEGK